MIHSKLSQTTIVLSIVALLSLMSSLSPPVLSMKTGYDYSTTGNPTTANQYRDLKCSYLFIAMTHMRLVRYLLDDKNTPTKFPVTLMGRYNIRAVICTLYGVADVQIATLWILLLYINMAQPFYKDYILKADETVRTVFVDHLVLVHDYVAGRMYVELLNARCRPGNQFDSYEQRYERLRKAMPSDHFDMEVMRDEVINNCKELNDLLETNSAKLTYGDRYDALKQRALFLDKLADNDRQKTRLMNGYALQIKWERAPALLTEYYEDARKLHSSSVLFHPLLPIKTYYRGVFGLIKCITYRLTWKFLFYFNTFTGKRRENFLEQLYELLVKIQTMLSLQDDLDIVKLLDYIDQLGRNNVGVNYVISKLQNRMHNFNIILQCEATNSWTLKSDQSPSSAQQGTSDQTYIIQGILKTTKTFYDELNFAFRKVDFDVVQSIVKYIDDEGKW